MKRHIPQVFGPLRRLRVRGLTYEYRYCPRCHREWPASQKSCPECLQWLGDRPLERNEWQLAPADDVPSALQRYELVGASAVVLRIVCGYLPVQEQMAEVAGVIRDILALTNDGATCGVAEHGWLVWTREGLRRAFRQGCEIEQRLVSSLPRLENILAHSAKIRWGIWIDQYVLPFGRQGNPVIRDITARAIFNFEPDNVLFSSEAIYRINRRWEHFVCAPRRLLAGHEEFSYRMIDHKRPSAFDHAEAGHRSPFVGRERQLSILEDARKRGGTATKLAIIAEAGSGKSRLIKEWLMRHPELRAISANFSLFGGDVESFASQLTELPADRLDHEVLVGAVVGRIRREEIDVLVLDDIHWAGPAGLAFVRRLLAVLSATTILIILASRSSGQELLQALQPTVELEMDPLPLSAAEGLARRLMASEAVATIAARRSGGNPLFVEQFVAWADETDFQGGKGGPCNLHQVIAARIEHLSDVRLADIRQRLRWGRSWERQAIDGDLERLEVEIGLWLDRLETGDYADRVEAARYLVKLESLDYEIFITSMLAGRPRPRSSRLREAIERLLIGSADQIFADLKLRAANGTDASREDIVREARRAGDVAFAAFDWNLAQDFYELAHSVAQPWQMEEIGRQVGECHRRTQKTFADDSDIFAISTTGRNLDEAPMVDALDLPDVWVQLGHRYSCARYFECAAEAAEGINDYTLAAWARRKAAGLRAGDASG